MINLYRTIFKHYAPKGYEGGIKEYFIANNDSEAFDIVDKKHNYECWHERSEQTNEYEGHGEEYGEEKGEYKKRMIAQRGQIDDEANNYEDLYYGLTHYGWEIVATDITPKDIISLAGLGIIEPIKVDSE